MSDLEKLKNQLLECNKELSMKLKELDIETDHCKYSKEHYEIVLKLCKESLKTVEETKKASNNIKDYLENLDLNSSKIGSFVLKQKLIDHLVDGPEIFEGVENTILDLMNVYKEKFIKKQDELLKMDVYHRIFLFYTKQVDPSIMEMTF